MQQRRWLVMLACAPMVTARGGGGDDLPLPVIRRLCPQAIDHNTVFTGGSGSGELVKVQLDTTKMTYQITYLASPISVKTGAVVPTRDTAPNNVQTDMLMQEAALSTEKLNQCAFRLNNVSLDPSRPTWLSLGLGVLGGTIPGVTIQFDSIVGVGKIAQITFPYYLFISFLNTETDLVKIAGNYNQLGYHQVPSQNFSQQVVDACLTINADGTYTRCDNLGVENGGACLTSSTMVNQKLTLRDDAPASTMLNYQLQVPATVSPLGPAKVGRGVMIVGKLYGQLVSILIRVGATNSDSTTGPPVADDEFGISIMAPVGNIAQGSQGGEYTGVDGTFNYRVTALVGAQATMLDPLNVPQAVLMRPLNLDFTQTVSSMIRTMQASAPAGSTSTSRLISVGKTSGLLDISDTKNPYFIVGAFAQ